MSVARKALETDTLHREEIASYGRRLLAGDKTHDELIDAATKLKARAPPTHPRSAPLSNLTPPGPRRPCASS